MEMNDQHGITSEELTEYRILVRGYLNGSWSKWFDGMSIAHIPGKQDTMFTKLTGIIPDQAALRGILNKIWDLNLTLVLVQQLC